MLVLLINARSGHIVILSILVLMFGIFLIYHFSKLQPLKLAYEKSGGRKKRESLLKQNRVEMDPESRKLRYSKQCASACMYF